MATRLRKTNGALYDAGKTYWETLGASITAIEASLALAGFQSDIGLIAPINEGEYRLHVEVGDNKWLSASWHRMESGCWEVVAYVN